MPFPKTAQRRGGKHPASEHQKVTARMWTLANEPWLKSSGPKTTLGLCVSSQNSRTHGLYRTFRPLTLAQLETLWRDPFYRAVERRLRQLELKQQQKSINFKQWVRDYLIPEILRRAQNEN